jgi:hypothetical protein
MIEFGGTIYCLDLDKLSETISLNSKLEKEITETVIKEYLDENGKSTGYEVLKTTKDRELTIDSTKYDLLRMMIEIITDDMEDTDDSLGVDRALEKTSLAYKIAFNTLHNYGILKEVE